MNRHPQGHGFMGHFVTTPGAWTVTTARAALPRVKQLLADARIQAKAMQELEEQLNDLRIVWGEAVWAVACPGHAEFAGYYSAFQAAQRSLGETMAAFHALGVEVKDIEQGLIDFRGQVGSEPAYICWKDAEPDIAWWHPLEGGFAARRKLPSLDS